MQNIKTISSEFKFGTILLLLLINSLSGILFWVLFVKGKINPLSIDFWKNESLLIAGTAILFLEMVALFLLLQVKTITIEKDKIIFRRLIFPFLKKEREFSYYDYSKLIDEASKNNTYEALWLIKNEKLEDRISSFYFSNYGKLKFEIKVKNKGKLNINPFKQLFCQMGMKI